MTTKEQEPEPVNLSPEKNNKQSETFNNNKEPYYRIEKLPKEDKGEKGKKNLFLNDSLEGSSFQATRKKLGKMFFTKRKKNKNNEYLETENTTTDDTLSKEKKVTEFLQRAQTIKYKGYN